MAPCTLKVFLGRAGTTGFVKKNADGGTAFERGAAGCLWGGQRLAEPLYRGRVVGGLPGSGDSNGAG